MRKNIAAADARLESNGVVPDGVNNADDADNAQYEKCLVICAAKRRQHKAENRQINSDCNE